ncbi:MAG: hypothetical protein PHU85_12120, partial [Phycisphaerae bacterium]|nr:hypothetical protein [Phycisphaerae bacterium]
MIFQADELTPGRHEAFPRPAPDWRREQRPSESLDSIDKKEECGLFAVYGRADAAAMVYQGLYSLQHRG